MTTVLWLAVLVACVVGASLASRRAVQSAIAVTERLGVSPAVVGVTVLAIGTDMPEIANSLVASATDHGDINVGDSMGSVVTQVTLVLGLLCLLSNRIESGHSLTLPVGLATVLASAVVWLLVGDGQLSHADGAVLVSLWAVGTILLGRRELQGHAPPSRSMNRRLVLDVGATIAFLGLVGAFAYGVVESFLSLAATFGIPEFVGSFVALSIGTSLPELIVDWTAIRRGASSMAIGDVFGSSFVDATLSIGIGPMVFAAAVSGEVVIGVVAAGVGVLLATVLVARARRFDRWLGISLLAVYAGVQLTTSVIAA
ncbi:MAG: hypothetical protein AAFN30_02290 [Actinomycetota bacterium]